METETLFPVELPAVRYCNPTKLDHAPMGTVVRVMLEFGYQLYIQTKDLKDELDEPVWIKMGCFLEDVFSEFTTDAEFLAEVMIIYQYKKEKRFARVSDIIKDRMK